MQINRISLINIQPQLIKHTPENPEVEKVSAQGGGFRFRQPHSIWLLQAVTALIWPAL